MQNPIPKIKQYYGETVQEVKKCSWPNRKELGQHTILVLAGVFLLTAFIVLSDYVLQFLVKGIYNIPNMF